MCRNISQIRFKLFAKYLVNAQKIAKDVKKLPNLWNFAKSGHTGE